jgi:hypothetical protein
VACFAVVKIAAVGIAYVGTKSSIGIADKIAEKTGNKTSKDFDFGSERPNYKVNDAINDIFKIPVGLAAAETLVLGGAGLAIAEYPTLAAASANPAVHDFISGMFPHEPFPLNRYGIAGSYVSQFAQEILAEASSAMKPSKGDTHGSTKKTKE